MNTALGFKTMKAHPFPHNLGLLLNNFQSLEFVLRAFLQNLPGALPFGIPHGVDIYSFPVGAELPVNEFTNYNSLGELIKKYNTAVRTTGGLSVDASLVDLRDALAHGRVAAPGESINNHLMKFSKPVGSKVRITFNEEMTADWFKRNIDRVNAAIHSVAGQLEPQHGARPQL